MNGNEFYLRPHGDRAVDLVFSEEISPHINSLVVGFSRVITDTRPDGVLCCLPSYRTLTVEYDPMRLTYGQLCLYLRSLSAKALPSDTGRLVRIPVCYSKSFAPDLEELAGYAHLTVREVINRHTAPDYHVYMIGFRPGFSYLGGLDASIACPRRAVPRQRIDAGSVGIAGGQTGVYPEASPGGWNIIGRTPLKLFDGKSALLTAGDTVRFHEISEDEFYSAYEREGKL